MKKEIYNKIIQKKEFSKLPKKDVELVFEKFDKEKYLDLEKIKLTRDLLRKVFSVFTSKKILSLKNRDERWILKKHISTRERLGYYEQVYSRILKGFEKLIIFDFGAGVNGFSYIFFEKIGFKVKYIATEAMGQLVDLMNNYFFKKKINAKAYHLSLFDLEKNLNLIKKQKGKKVIFLFKVLDSLEMVERNYSKKLLLKMVPLVDRVVISFATKSLMKHSRFKVKRNWLIYFLKENFDIVDDFEINSERYIVIKKKCF